MNEEKRDKTQGKAGEKVFIDALVEVRKQRSREKNVQYEIGNRVTKIGQNRLIRYRTWFYHEMIFDLSCYLEYQELSKL